MYLFFDYIDLKIVSNEITNNLLEQSEMNLKKKFHSKKFWSPNTLTLKGIIKDEFEEEITEYKIVVSQYKGYKWKLISKKFWILKKK